MVNCQDRFHGLMWVNWSSLGISPYISELVSLSHAEEWCNVRRLPRNHVHPASRQILPAGSTPSNCRHPGLVYIRYTSQLSIRISLRASIMVLTNLVNTISQNNYVLIVIFQLLQRLGTCESNKQQSTRQDKTQSSGYSLLD